MKSEVFIFALLVLLAGIVNLETITGSGSEVLVSDSYDGTQPSMNCSDFTFTNTGSLAVFGIKITIRADYVGDIVIIPS